jgi:nucleotide-binding universal stress UspA family protein
MKKILVPIDFSKPSQIASDVATGIARKAGADVILLHIVEQVTDAPFNTEGEVMYSGSMEEKLFMMKLIEKSKKKLERAADRLIKNGIKVKQELIIGRPYHAISKMIVNHKVDLVVMGTAGHSKLEKMVIGTNTERVVRHAKCPVLSVHEKPTSISFKNIVYATAMSKDEEVFSTAAARRGSWR